MTFNDGLLVWAGIWAAATFVGVMIECAVDAWWDYRARR